MKMNKNNRGQILSVGMIMALFLGIVLLIFLFGGGLSTILKITKGLKAVPTFIWIGLGFFILIKMFSGRRR